MAALWKPRPEFLAAVRKIDDETLDPLRPGRASIVGAQRSEAPAELGRKDEAPAAARAVEVAEPVYDIFQGVLDPAKVCGTCKHFRHGYGQQIVQDPKFMQFMTKEAKFIPELRRHAEGDEAPRLPWFDQAEMGLCNERRGMVTPRVATCTHWSKGEGMQFTVPGLPAQP